MKKHHKILLYLIFLILTAGQAAAWDQSFESHDNDIPLSDMSGYSIESQNHGYVSMQADDSILKIEKPFTSQLSFSAMPSQGVSCSFIITMYNTAGSAYFTHTAMTSLSSSSVYQRIDIIKTASGIDVLNNGNLVSSAAFPTSYGTAKNVTIKFHSSPDGRYFYIDDLTSSPSIISCDSTADLTNGQYYRIGFTPSTAVTWYTKITNPNGTTITQDITAQSTYQISPSFITESGTYYIRLYQHNIASGKNYYFTVRPFTYSQESSGNSIILDKSEYSPGDTIKVWTYVPDFTPLTYTESGYKIAWRVYTDAYAGEDGEETKDVLCYDLASEEQWGYLVLPDDVPAGVGKEVRLVNPDGQDVAIATYDVLTDYNPSAEWSQDTYELNDTAKLLISQAPTGSTITFRVYSQNTLMQETTLDVTSSTGSKSINLADYTTGDKLLAILKNADGYILDQDYATVRIGDYTVSGRVYDALTGAAVPGATIQIHTESTTTDTKGGYSLIGRAGQSVVEITADGYNTYSGHVTIQDLISTRHFYIVPILEGETSGLYGIVTSFDTSKPLESALVTITKDSTTYSTTTNSRGYYQIEKAGLNGTCTVRVSKTNYDTYSGYVSVSGMTLLQVKLVAGTNYDEGDGGGDGDTSSPSSSSSTTSTDRPDREAAKESLSWLEGNIPGLIQIVVLVFILALFGVKF